MPHLLRSMIAEWLDAESEQSDILRGMLANNSTPTRDALFWVLRHFAAVATGLGSSKLFEFTLKLTSTLGIPFADVLFDLESQMLPEDETPMHEPMRASLEDKALTEGLYFCSRRLNPTRDGNFPTWTSSNFAASVCTNDELRAGWTQREGTGASFWDTFVHPDDKSVIPMAAGRIVASMASFELAKMEGRCEHSSGLLRIMMGGAYVPCEVQVHIGALGGQWWLCIRAAPLALLVSGDGNQLASQSYANPFPPPLAMLEIGAADAVDSKEFSNETKDFAGSNDASEQRGLQETAVSIAQTAEGFVAGEALVELADIEALLGTEMLPPQPQR